MLPRRHKGEAGLPASRQDEHESAAGLLRRLQWTVLRPLATALGGDERSLVRGPGMELTEVREYQPGDDVRYIDWNITAREDRPFVRDAHVERALDVWMALDLSGSISWGTAQCTKRERAVEFVAVAGQLLQRHGNQVGALLFADRPLGFVPPGAGRTHLLRMLGAVRDAPRQEATGRTDLCAALERLDATARRRALVLVVSDFLVPDGWQSVLRRLAQRHEVVAVRLRDPREAELPDVGLVTLEDPETGVQLLVNTGDRGLRKRFQAAAQAQAERIKADLAASGVDQVILSTDAALLPALVRYLNGRRLRRATGAARAGLRRAASAPIYGGSS